MADKVEHVMQDMVPELDDLRAKQIFDDAELKQIIKRRRDFEYLLLRQPSKPQDYLGYVRYELALDSLRSRRSKALHWKKRSVSDFAGVRRVHSIFGRGLQKFKGDLRFWYQYVDFCLRSGSSKMLSRVLLQGVKIHPREVNFWLLSADRELKYGHIKAARTMLLRGLRFLPRSAKLWAEFLRLEVQVARNVVDLERIKEADKDAPLVGEASSVVISSATVPESTPSQSSNSWAPASLLLRRALAKLDASPISCAEFLTVAVRCVEKATKSCTQEALSSFAEQVRSAVADRRPGVYAGAASQAAWADIPADVSVKLWVLWWSQERARGRGWRGIARAVAANAPAPVVQHCAQVLVAARKEAKAGAPMKALAELVEAQCAVAESETALVVLEALEQCKQVDESAATAYNSLLQRAMEAHPSCLRLRLLDLQKSEASPPDAATLLDSVHNLQPADAAQYLALVTAVASTPGSSSEDTPKVDIASAFEASLRSLAPGTSARPVAELFLAEALSRGIADFRTACNQVMATTVRLWQVPSMRTELHETVVNAELRVIAPPDMPPPHMCKRIEELLSLLSNDDPRKIEWWVRYVEFAHRAKKWGCGSGVPSVADLHWRASRSVDNQAVFTERYQELLQFLS